MLKEGAIFLHMLNLSLPRSKDYWHHEWGDRPTAAHDEGDEVVTLSLNTTVSLTIKFPHPTVATAPGTPGGGALQWIGCTRRDAPCTQNRACVTGHTVDMPIQRSLIAPAPLFLS